MVSIRWHFVPNPVFFSKPRFAAKCKASSVFHTRYDAWNRLVAVYQDDGDGAYEPDADDTFVIRNQYDGLNRRIKKINKIDKVGETENQWGNDYYYNQDWQIVEDRYGSTTGGTVYTEQYVWGPGYVDSPIASLHDGNHNGNVDDTYNQGTATNDWRRYYLTDANHNVTTTIRFDRDDRVANTAAIARNVYTAYGSVTQYGANWTDTSAEIGFDGPRYCGYFFDVETGLYQVRNRYYDPGLSTWISRDPVGYSAGSNLYAYCGNGPLTTTDPTGLAEATIQAWNPTWYERAWMAVSSFVYPTGRSDPLVDFHENVVAPALTAAGQNSARLGQGSVRLLAGGAGTVVTGGAYLVEVPYAGEAFDASSELTRRGAADVAASLGFGGDQWLDTVSYENITPSSAAQFMEAVRSQPGVSPLVYRLSVGSEIVGDVAWEGAQGLHGTKLGSSQLRLPWSTPRNTLAARMVKQYQTVGEFSTQLASPPPQGWRYWTELYTPKFINPKITPDPMILAQTGKGRHVLSHELKHFTDAMDHPEFYYFSRVSTTPGAGFSHVAMEMRGYLQSHGLRGLNPVYAMRSVKNAGRLGLVYRDAAITVGLGAATGASYYLTWE